jgi:hypothetical protein
MFVSQMSFGQVTVLFFLALRVRVQLCLVLVTGLTLSTRRDVVPGSLCQMESIDWNICLHANFISNLVNVRSLGGHLSYLHHVGDKRGKRRKKVSLSCGSLAYGCLWEFLVK